MLISEIFYSISGESVNAGYPTIFVRTFGCNLRCDYCDSMYSVVGKDFREMTVEEVINEIKKIDCKRVILTGGEPLLQKDMMELIGELIDDDYRIEIETNGAVEIAEVINWGGATITMDWKCPSSGVNDKMLESNLAKLHSTDVIKFVVGSTEDLDEMKRILPRTRAKAFVSPVFGKIEPKDIVQYLLDNHLNNVRFQLQIHKFVWDPNERGV